MSILCSSPSQEEYNAHKIESTKKKRIYHCSGTRETTRSIKTVLSALDSAPLTVDLTVIPKNPNLH